MVPMQHSEHTRDEIITLLIARDGDMCKYCHRSFDERERTIDHVYPQSRAYAEGWTYAKVNALSNLALACKPCNAKKGDSILDESGNIPPRNARIFRYRREKRAQRPDICTSCEAGRALGPDEICASCGSGPMPDRFPRWAKVPSTECLHDGIFWCWACSIGIVEMRSAAETILFGVEGEERGLR